MSGLYLLIPGMIAFLTGRPFIFPSLGPTAYVLAFDLIPKKTHSPRTIVGGHVCGVFGGLLSYHLLVSPIHLTEVLEPLSLASGVLILGAAIALLLTIFLMLLLDASHPPACATTLIVSLGILPGFADGLIIIGAVILMYIGYRIIQHLIITTEWEVQ